MADAPTLSSVLESVRSLVEAGASLHWLFPFDHVDQNGFKRGKTPRAAKWQDERTLSLDDLKKGYRGRSNIGIRLGKPSRIFGYYLYIIDLDIRKAELAEEAWAELLRMFPGARGFPMVISGSGGPSRHIYFLSDRPFAKRKLAKSQTHTMVWDDLRKTHVAKNDWEIDLMGTGSQAVLPPSIHPDSHLPYRWDAPLDFDLLELGIGPIVPAEQVESWGVREVAPQDDEDDLETLWANSPLDLSEDEIDEILALIPNDTPEVVDGEVARTGAHYDDYIEVGMALHHQYQGDEHGFQKWVDWASQSSKFDLKHARYRWDKSFGDSRNPVRMATLIQKANAYKMAVDHDFDLDDDDFDSAPDAAAGTALVKVDSFALDDLLADGKTPEPVRPGLPAVDPDWQTLLARNEDGDLKSNLHNIKLIVANDPRCRGVARFNEFASMIRKKAQPKVAKKKRASAKPVVNLEGRLWAVRDKENGDPWLDAHDHGIRAMLEAPTTQGGFGIKVSDRDLRAAIDAAAYDFAFHPVREAIEKETWDGSERASRLFIDYFDCPDTPYYRQVALMTLLAAVVRIYEPGHKFDYVTILEGAQGKGKSTFIRELSMGWFNELTGDIGDPKEMIEVMQGSWIMEIGELSAMHKSEVNELKQFVSRTEDKGRPAYERRVQVFPRQCIFIGSTNDKEYLRDHSGDRRYWPVECFRKGQIDNARLQRERLQIWAEVLVMYREMRAKQPFGNLPLFLTDEAAATEAVMLQQSRKIETAEDVLAGQILHWLDQPIDDAPEFDDLDADAPKIYRDATCTQEIWVEVLGGRTNNIPQSEAIKIGRAMGLVGWKRSRGVTKSYRVNEKYGPCRVYIKP